MEIGTTLGVYRITGRIGAGGMGEVYRAIDTRLGREVAIKVLPDSVDRDPERLARFEREARAASALNHPNICTIHDVGDYTGRPYIVMELLGGTSLCDRIDVGAIPIVEVLTIGVQLADALATAHAAGIVHRDVKPGNIFVTERGDAKILDFGLARFDPNLVDSDPDAEAPTVDSPDLTRTGATLGTAAYMSPEQVLGAKVDERSDVFSLGIVLYEMITGGRPFDGHTSGAVFDQIIHSTPTSPSSLNPDAPRELERIVKRCLEKKPAGRWTAAELRDALQGLLREHLHGTVDLPSRLRRWSRKPGTWLAAAILVAGGIGGIVLYSSHSEKVEWARGVALPRLRELALDPRTGAVEGFQLIERAGQVLADDAEFLDLRSRLVGSTAIRTDPAAAVVFYRPYTEPESEWQRVGVTPIESVELPNTYLRWRVEKVGFEPVVDVQRIGQLDWKSGTIRAGELEWTLLPEGMRPRDMVAIDGDDTLPDFLIDRYEVTNRQFKQFVDAGGYQDPELWRFPLVDTVRPIARDQAMGMLVDRSGRPGPATWEAGDYPEGDDDLPVTGVSWYEAAAYAEFVGKSLPTIHHWDRARGIHVADARWGFTSLLMPQSNFGGLGPVPVGSTHAMTPLGALDMAGNVREWCFNQAPDGRCIRGGGWNDQTYMFSNITQANPFDRSATNGFRCMQALPGAPIPEDVFEPFRVDVQRDLANEIPVSDEVFTVYRERFDYDDRPLDPRVEETSSGRDDWVRETVSYRAAYDDERIIAQLFLPKNAEPPYQTVLYFPGSSATRATSSDTIEHRNEFRSNVAFLVKTGRAVLWPAYRGTYERFYEDSNRIHFSQAPTLEFTDYQTHLVKDVKRSIDYLASRTDIDGNQIAYFGFSWGGQVANMALAVEKRFKAAVLLVGGLASHGTPRPEVDYINFTPRVTVPVLMLNGRYDLALLYDAEVQPMFELLGTPAEHKRLVVYETDHIIDRNEVIKESLAWLDTYLGPVELAGRGSPDR